MSTIPSKEELEALYAVKTDESIAQIYNVGASTVRRWRRMYLIMSKPRGPRPTVSRSRVTDAEIANMIKVSNSISDLCRRLDLCETGAGSTGMKRRVQALGLDTSHFHSKPVHVLGVLGKRLSIECILQPNTYRASSHIRKRILAAGLLEERCVVCGLQALWNKKPLSLQLDHTDGDPSNNVLSNLRLLCPNCHSQTPTFAGRNKVKGRTPRKKRPEVPKDIQYGPIKPKGVPLQCQLERCGKVFWRKHKPSDPKPRFCSYGCHKVSMERTAWPSDAELHKLLWEIPALKLAKKLGVSCNAVKKRCLTRGIDTPGRGYWAKQKAAAL